MSQDPSKPGKQPVRLGKYEVLSRIGKGGMGSVFRAIDTDLQRLVALKIMSPEMAARPDMVERFKREARSAAKLRHENIVAIYEFGEIQGTYFLALEFVDGKDLHDYVARKGKLDPEEARAILLQGAHALDHAHRQGIVHRDIKPANFLITQVGGRLHVKLTDLGLARIKGDEEARLTRDHATVGTVDYMSPEQAQNSRAADIRSDIYSLGCTLYHMLAGHCPFNRGSIPERIIAHIKTEPPDIRGLNDKVPPDLVLILRKMLAKKPRERYQTPEELLSDLETPLVGLQPLDEPEPETKKISAPRKEPAAPPKSSPKAIPSAAPSAEEEEKAKSSVSDQGTGTEGAQPRARKKRRRGEDQDEKKGPAKKPFGVWYGVAGALLLGAGFVLWLSTRPGSGPGKVPSTGPPQVSPGPVVEKKEPDPLVVEKGTPTGPPLPKHPALFIPIVPLDPVKLRQEFLGEAPPFPAPPADAEVIVWKRSAGENQARTLAAAVSKAKTKGPTVIEIHDNGPLWVSSQALKGRTFFLRAAKGYRPLLAWDTRTLGKEKGNPAWLLVEEASLILEGIDLVVRWDGEPAGADLIRLVNAPFFARDCTFSLSGKGGPEAVFLRAEGASALRLSQCFLRGPDMTLLALRGKLDVTIEGSLLVGGAAPLIHWVNQGDNPTALRLIRSTLVAGQNALTWHLEPSKSTAHLNVLAWDCLLARAENDAPKGDMVVLSGPARVDHLHWRAVNCIYSGWRQFLQAPEMSVGSGSLLAFRALWRASEGEHENHLPWPPRLPEDTGNVPASAFQPRDPRVRYAALEGPGTLGCVIGALPPGPSNWVRGTYESYPVPAPDLIEETAPAFLAPAEGLFQAEVDLSKKDLGEFLDDLLKSGKGLNKVVLHLKGTGKVLTSPIKVQGVRHLVLYFLQTAKGKEEPLTLAVKPGALGSEGAFLDMEGGMLEMVQGRIWFPDNRFILLPPYMIRLRDGALRLRGCQFQGPYEKAPDSYQGLIRWEATKKGEGPMTGVIQDCVLQGQRRLVEIDGANLTLRCKNNLFYAGEDALSFQAPRTSRPRLSLTLENNTIAVRKRFLTIQFPEDTPWPEEPVLVSATQNYFLDPFAAEPRQSTLLFLSARDVSLGRLHWQGKSNALDEARWHTLWAADNPGADKPGADRVLAADWLAWWGPGEQDWKKVAPAPAAKAFPIEAPLFERLLPPPPYRLGLPPPFGADLLRLGLVKKKG